MSSINPYAAPQGSQLIREPRPVPTSVGEILSAGTSLFATHLGTWAAMVLVVWLPLELATSYLAYFVIDPDDAGSTFRMSVLFEVVFGIIVIGGIIQLGHDAWRGEPIHWARGLLAGLSAWPRLFSTRLIGGIVMLLGLILMVLPGLYIAVRIALSDQVSVLERKGGMQALPRSMDLSNGKFLRYLLLSFATYGPLLLFSTFHQMPLVFWPQLDHWLASTALSLLVDLAEPWLVLVFVVAYISETAGEGLPVESQPQPAIDATYQPETQGHPKGM